ncbi:hypothetical protein BJX76DRAFT_321069 [Aspergillus varians]
MKSVVSFSPAMSSPFVPVRLLLHQCFSATSLAFVVTYGTCIAYKVMNRMITILPMPGTVKNPLHPL